EHDRIADAIRETVPIDHHGLRRDPDLEDEDPPTSSMPPSAFAKAATHLTIVSRTSRRASGFGDFPLRSQADLNSRNWPSG
ncbi:MAG: hypothetical protein SGJ13_02595, partial [Actinomycetota bacterium]|nr:hypothetical protein [Actinomycetota bacterium]